MTEKPCFIPLLDIHFYFQIQILNVALIKSNAIFFCKQIGFSSQVLLSLFFGDFVNFLF